jgi:GNAT superfamily N-acetyltransferase
MIPITARQTTLSDLDALAPLFDGYRQFYGRDSDVAAARAFLLERFNHGESVVFLAYQGDAPVGFTQLYPSFSSVSMARVFVLNDLFVCASARRMGVGARLMAAATEYARTVGAVRLTLSTATSNATAQSLYEAAGWKRDESFFVYNLAVSQ